MSSQQPSEIHDLSSRSTPPYQETGVDPKQPHGVVEVHYDNGQVHSRGEYSNGKLHGFEQVFHYDGVLSYSAEYFHGQKHGFEKFFDGYDEWVKEYHQGILISTEESEAGRLVFRSKKTQNGWVEELFDLDAKPIEG